MIVVGMKENHAETAVNAQKIASSKQDGKTPIKAPETPKTAVRGRKKAG